MKLRYILLLGLVPFIACNDEAKGPDVSKIEVNVVIERFDRDVFSLDTTTMERSLSDLYAKYSSLYPIFMRNILALEDSNQNTGFKRFIRQTKFIDDEANEVFKNTHDLEKEFAQAFRYVKYYFSGYKESKIITLIGPPDALARTAAGEPTPNFIGPDFIGVSLQFYLGKDFSIYKDPFFISNIAPEFRSRRFDKKYIVADVMKLVIDDIYPEKLAGKGLIEQMIEKGKQWWLLDKFLPNAHDSIKTGYTKEQLNWCDKYEGMIWNEIITTQKDLYTKEPMAIQNYIGEGPFTQSLGPGSPGNIGQWIGWQIVKKFADKNSSMKVMDVLKTDAKKILEEAKYKPK